MQTVDEYINNCDPSQREAFLHLRTIIKQNLPQGFEEGVSYKMLGYSVPLSIYPKGYLNDPTRVLPFINIDIKKRGIHFYHMGIYADEALFDRFVDEWKKVSKHTLDYGKSCFRFKYRDEIPFDAIADLVQKISVQEWITLYETRYNRKSKPDSN